MTAMQLNKAIYKALAAFTILFCTTGCIQKQPPYTTIDGFAQGGTYHIVYQNPADADHSALPDSLAVWFRQIDKSLSGYDTTSLVSQINRGENPPLDQLFIECFNLSREVYEATEGAFDISGAPLFDIWGFGFREKMEITPQMIDSIMTFVGMDKLSITYDSTSSSYHLSKSDPRMKVNFNAIAQGYSCVVPPGFCGQYPGVSVPLRVVPSSKGLSSKRCPGIGILSRVNREIGVFRHVSPSTWLCLEYPRETGLILRCTGKGGNPFKTKQGNRPSCRDQEGRRGPDVVVPGTSVFSSSQTGVSRNF